jgi:pimeloyl-ACP methyl ester carboxylesterase
MATIALLGHPTWALMPKKGATPVLLLHGGMSSSASLLHSVGPRLKRHFNIGAFDRRGHGRTADSDAPFSYEAMAEEVVAFIELLGRPCHLVGHSDGANAALLAALARPDLVTRLVLIGANYHVEGLMPMPHLDEGSLGYQAWVAHYASISPDGSSRAHLVFRKTMEMQATGPTLTNEDLRRVTVPTLVMAGDDDVATLAHTASLYESIPGAQLCIVPGTSHSLLKERPKECARTIRRFLTQDLPVQTRMPLRRALDS